MDFARRRSLSTFQFHVSRDGTDSVASNVAMASRSAARVRRVRNCRWIDEVLLDVVELASDDAVDRFMVVWGVDESIAMDIDVTPWLLIDAKSRIRVHRLSIVITPCDSTGWSFQLVCKSSSPGKGNGTSRCKAASLHSEESGIIWATTLFMFKTACR